MSTDLDRFWEADRRLVAVARDIKVLSALSWPPDLRGPFLERWRAGKPRLPAPPAVAPPPDLAARVEALAPLTEPLGDHPIARFLARTARSYVDTARLIGAAGTPAFADLSTRIYGRPRDPVVPGGQLTNLEAARRVHRVTDDLAAACAPREEAYCLTPEEVARRMRATFGDFFDAHPVAVEIDPGLAAKAAAGADAVRLRAGTCFSEDDVHQLVQHEAFVHTATAINGREQPRLTALGLGAPRTTATQEGLATFAELITSAIDLNRLRRLALRIEAVDMGLEGADFVEVLRFFLEAGQTEAESFNSAARVFRGGDVRGGVVFTKDAVYLRGLLKTHAWLHAALAERKLAYPHYLFAGRLTWGDVEELEPCFAEGIVAPPRYEPAWVARRDNLAAYLAFSLLSHELPLSETELTDFAPTGRYGPIAAEPAHPDEVTP